MENKMTHSASILNARLLWKIVWVVVYGITAFYTYLSFTDMAHMMKWMMYAMAWMAGGMLAEAIVGLVYHCCGKDGNGCH